MHERPVETPRQIWIESPLPIGIFTSLISVPLLLALCAGLVVNSWKMHPTLHVVLQLAVVASTFFSMAIVFYRLFLHYFPFGEGEIIKGSKNEVSYQVYCLFWILVFNNFMLPGIIPIPLRGLILNAFGARIGSHTTCVGYVHEPHLVTIGNDSLLGMGSMILPHNLNVGYLSHQRVTIGNGVTIGAHSVIAAGVQIEDGAIVGLNSVVTRNTHIKANEVWAGIPARKIKNREDLRQ